jgi:hypothetical protein
MNELAQLVPGDIDFPFLAVVYGAYSDPPYIWMFAVIAPCTFIAFCMWFSNKEAGKQHGSTNVWLQCISRVFLDTALVVGICGTAIGVVAATPASASDLSDDIEGYASWILTPIFWGGVIASLGYFLRNPAVPIKATVSGRGAAFSFLFFILSITYLIVGTTISIADYFLPRSQALIPYLTVFTILIVFLRLNGKPWIVSLTEANLMATIGGLGMGIIFWFSSGGGFVEGRAAIYTSALTLTWGTFFYVLAYIASLYLGAQEQVDYQTKTWHLSEAALFFLFLFFAPVGVTEWKRESQDQAVQEANNQAQELRIEQLEAQLVELRALIKSKETS